MIVKRNSNRIALVVRPVEWRPSPLRPDVYKSVVAFALLRNQKLIEPVFLEMVWHLVMLLRQVVTSDLEEMPVFQVETSPLPVSSPVAQVVLHCHI